MNRYTKQRKHMREASAYITDHVSPAKNVLLEQSDSVYQWLVTLKEDTKPTDNYLWNKAQQHLDGTGRDGTTENQP